MKTNFLHSILFLAAYAFCPQFSAAQMTFSVQGDAYSIGNDCYHLTVNKNHEKGAIWNHTFLDLDNDFEISFSAYFGDQNSGADGMAFVLQNDIRGLVAIGSDGGRLGYGGTVQPVVSSLAVEFDTYQNVGTEGDIGFPDDHIAIVENANQASPLTPIVNASAVSLDIEDNNDHDIIIRWNAATTTLSVYFDGALRTSLIKDIATSTFGGVSSITWGITAATGGKNNIHRVCINSVSTCTRPSFQAAIGEAPSVYGLGEEGFSVKSSPWDCGYVVAGRSLHPTTNLDHMIVTKTMENGTVDWIRKYIPTVGTGEGVLQDVEVLEDGYIVTGWLQANWRDFFLMRLNSNGMPIWSSVVAEDRDQIGFDVQQTPDQGFIVVGRSADEVLLVKFDANGNKLWANTYGVENQVWEGLSIEPTDDDRDGIRDDGFIIAGTRRFLDPFSIPISVGTADWIVLKTDASGLLQWTESITGTEEEDVPHSIKQIDTDGDGILDIDEYIVGGYMTHPTASPLRREAVAVFVNHTSSTYNSIWYSDGVNNSEIHALEQTQNGGFILNGHIHEAPLNSNRDAFLINTDIAGSVLWNKYYGDADRNDWGTSVEEMNDLGYTFTGGTNSFPHGDQNMYLVKTDVNGNSPCKTQVGSMSETSYDVYANIEGPSQKPFFTAYFTNVTLPEVILTEADCFTEGPAPVDVGSTQKMQELSAFPNPINSGEVLHISVDEIQPTHIIVNDFMGREVYQSHLDQVTAGQINLSTDNWKAGVYMITLYTSDNIYTHKITLK